MTEIIGTEQLAEKLNASVHSVRYWRTIGFGPRSTRIGRHVVYRRADVDAWIRAEFDSRDNVNRH
jgi:DNA-binding transcriptional MerR regulator